MSKRLDKNVKAAVGLILDGAMRSIDTGVSGSHGLNAFAIAVAICEVLSDWDLLEEPARQVMERHSESVVMAD